MENDMVTDAGRRRFLTAGFWAIVAIIAGGFAYPLMRYVSSPVFRRLEKEWIEIGGVGDFPMGEPTLVSLQPPLEGGVDKINEDGGLCPKPWGWRLYGLFHPLHPHGLPGSMESHCQEVLFPLPWRCF